MKSWKKMLPCLAGAVSQIALAGSAAAGTGVAWLELEGTPSESPSPFAWLGMEESDTLRGLVEKIDEVAYHDDCEGLVIRLKDAQLKVTQVQELGRALKRIRDAGKKVHIYAENYSTPGLLLGSYADEVMIQSGGTVSLPGIYMQEMYLRDTLNWIGLQPDFVQIGDYKGADETIMNSGPSKAWDENISGLLDSMYDNVRDMLMDGYGFDEQRLDEVMKQAWWASDKQAIDLGLIDAAVDLPVIMDHLEEEYGEPVDVAVDLNDDASDMKLDAANPFAMLSMLTQKPSHTATRPTIAVLHIDGPIVDGDSQPASLFGGSSVGSRTLRNAIEDILDQDLIKGCVVRIDSPGGSAVASEIIWQGLQRLKHDKPVWVSVGSMAASGGYYCAVGGSKIYADESSIVGSIGVVGGKIAMGGLYDKLHLNIVERTRGPMAGLESSVEPWTEEQRSLIRDRMRETYEQFAGHVKDARAGIDLSKTAEGRLFTGERAKELHMIDEIGGLDDALNDLGAELGMDDFDVMDFPGPKSFDELLQDVFGRFAGVRAPSGAARELNAAMEAFREVLGPERFSVLRDAINANMQLQKEPVLLTMPRVILVH